MTDFATKFFEYTYFGTVFDRSFSLGQMEIEAVGMRAYRDLNRTLRYKEGTDVPDQWGMSQRRYFAAGISSDELAVGVNSLLECKTMEEFDYKHKRCCSEILDIANGPQYDFLLKEKLTYGQVQKWLNMTMKYLLILGYVPDNIKGFLHVPIDDYILDAVWSTNHGESRYKERLQSLVKHPAKLPFAANASKSYDSAKIQKWSKWKANDRDPDLFWECAMYDDFQNGIRKALEGSKVTPIEWESEAWIIMARKRNSLKGN